MAELVEIRISTFENNSIKKTVGRNFSLIQPTTKTMPIFSEEETLLLFFYRRVIQQIQPLTLSCMAGSLTNIQFIWSNGSKRVENSREQSIAAFPSF